MAEQLATIAVPATRVGGYSPLSALNAAQKNVDLDRKRRDEEAAERDAAAVGQVMSQHPEDPDTAIKVLKQTGFHGAAAALQKRVTEERTKAVELRGKEAELQFKNGQITAQQAEAEHKALMSKRIEDWARHLKENPALARGQLRSFLGPEKWLEYEAKIEAARVAAENQVRDDERAAAAAAEAARHNTATEGLTLSGQQNAAAIAAANRAAADARAAATLQAQKDRAAAGTGPGGVKLSATSIQKVAAVDQARGILSSIEKLLPNMADAIGPIDQYLTKAKIATGKGATTDLATFDAQIQSLHNNVIQATTGAQMSEPEAKRILNQVPNLGNSPTVFKARMITTRNNLELLKKRIIELSSGNVEGEAAGPTQVGGFLVEEE